VKLTQRPIYTAIACVLQTLFINNTDHAFLLRIHTRAVSLSPAHQHCRSETGAPEKAAARGDAEQQLLPPEQPAAAAPARCFCGAVLPAACDRRGTADTHTTPPHSVLAGLPGAEHLLRGGPGSGSAGEPSLRPDPVPVRAEGRVGERPLPPGLRQAQGPGWGESPAGGRGSRYRITGLRRPPRLLSPPRIAALPPGKR